MESRRLSGGEMMFESIPVDALYPRWLTARDKGEACTIIDVRTPEEYGACAVGKADCAEHIDGACA